MNSPTEHFWINSTCPITITGLRDLKGHAVNGASLVGVLRGKAGETVRGVEPIKFEHIADSDGDYECVLKVPKHLKDRNTYELAVEVNDRGREFTFVITRTAKTYRK